MIFSPVAGCSRGFGTLAKSHAVYPTWLGVRFSYGMNGVVMRTRDLAPFARYLATHVSRQPRISSGGSGRRVVERTRATTAGRVLVYRYNLMEHVGEVSTFAVRPGRPEWPRCYDPMSEVWSLGAAETFDDASARPGASSCLPGYGGVPIDGTETHRARRTSLARDAPIVAGGENATRGSSRRLVALE